MTELLSRFAAILLASATPVLASPEVTPYVTTASGWNVYYHNGSGNCGMVREHRLGTRVIVNYERSNDTWTFSLSNPKWDLVHNGEKYHVYMTLDGTEKWQGDFIGSVWSGRPLISLPNTKVDFLKQFMAGERMTIGTRNDGDVTTVNLDGSWDAVLRVAECQKAHN
jgi:hypothetical protein